MNREDREKKTIKIVKKKNRQRGRDNLTSNLCVSPSCGAAITAVATQCLLLNSYSDSSMESWIYLPGKFQPQFKSTTLINNNILIILIIIF